MISLVHLFQPNYQVSICTPYPVTESEDGGTKEYPLLNLKSGFDITAEVFKQSSWNVVSRLRRSPPDPCAGLQDDRCNENEVMLDFVLTEFR